MGRVQSRSQTFVPLDQWSESESSGSIHFQITMETTEFCISGFTAQCAVRIYGIYGACLKWMLPKLSFSYRWSRGTKLWERDWAEFGFFLCYHSFRVSRFFTAGQGERRLWEKDWQTMKLRGLHQSLHMRPTVKLFLQPITTAMPSTTSRWKMDLLWHVFTRCNGRVLDTSFDLRDLVKVRLMWIA